MRKKTNITVRTRSDGTLVRVLPDGSEQPLSTPTTERTLAEIEAAALTDPDNLPLDRADLRRMKSVPRVKTIRRALGLTQEQFAAQYQIPLGTLRDWEQGRSEPDQAAKGYLNAIARAPGVALQRPGLPIDIRQADIEVRDRRDTSVRGTTTGQIRRHAGRDLAGVRLINGETKFVPLEHLELLPKHETRVEAFAAQRTGGPTELVRHLLAEKISGKLTDVYYSMESGKAEFFPHQFRPVLTFVEVDYWAHSSCG